MTHLVQKPGDQGHPIKGAGRKGLVVVGANMRHKEGHGHHHHSRVGLGSCLLHLTFLFCFLFFIFPDYLSTCIYWSQSTGLSGRVSITQATIYKSNQSVNQSINDLIKCQCVYLARPLLLRILPVLKGGMTGQIPWEFTWRHLLKVKKTAQIIPKRWVTRARHLCAWYTWRALIQPWKSYSKLSTVGCCIRSWKVWSPFLAVKYSLSW